MDAPVESSQTARPTTTESGALEAAEAAGFPGSQQLHAPVLPATRALLRKPLSALRD